MIKLTMLLFMLIRGTENENRLQQEQNERETAIPIQVYGIEDDMYFDIKSKAWNYGPQTFLDENEMQVQKWLLDCPIHKVYKVADTGDHTSIYHQAVMIRSDDDDESCQNFGLLIHFDGFREQLLKDLKMPIPTYKKLSLFAKVKFHFKMFKESHFRALDPYIKIEYVKVTPGELYSPKWAAPSKSGTNKKSFNFFFDKHKDRQMVKFEHGIKMELSMLKKFIRAVPLTKYRNWPSNKYFNCWRASNYIIYAFRQLQDCRDKQEEQKALWSVDERISTCFPEISENLTCRKKYNSKCAKWSKKSSCGENTNCSVMPEDFEEVKENSNKI